jgi:predicted  nucleic acid-binding Zn-ribbon protein
MVRPERGTLSAVLPALAALISLQQLDSLADRARRRLADLPAAEEALNVRIAEAAAAVDAVKAQLADNQATRRTLEKDVAGVDSRLARFDDHKAAVKTNQEYTALLHEIATAKGEKDAIEDQILGLMEAGDVLTAERKAAETALADTQRDVAVARAALGKERVALADELERLAHDRAREAAAVDAPLLARYEQLLKQRRGIAVAAMAGEICEACFVRQRPSVAQQIRRNDTIIQCESCQRILYFVAPSGSSGSVSAG